MQQWEYLAKKVNPNYLNRFLDEYGEKGWELVNAFPYYEWIMFIFKRPITQ